MPMLERLAHCFRSSRRRAPATQEGRADSDRNPATSPASHLFPSFPPPPPRLLLERNAFWRDTIRKRKYAAPKGHFEDGPSFCLFRLYEHIVLDNNIGMRNELETFWWTPWSVKDIPDPKDFDEPERYAVLACRPYLLVESFNERNKLGLRREGRPIMTDEERETLAASTPDARESLPSWVLDVLPLEKLLYISYNIEGETQLERLDDKRASPPLKAKNIFIWHPHIHFV